jgi:hypothetical protein
MHITNTVTNGDTPRVAIRKNEPEDSKTNYEPISANGLGEIREPIPIPRNFFNRYAVPLSPMVLRSQRRLTDCEPRGCFSSTRLCLALMKNV